MLSRRKRHNLFILFWKYLKGRHSDRRRGFPHMDEMCLYVLTRAIHKVQKVRKTFRGKLVVLMVA